MITEKAATEYNYLKLKPRFAKMLEKQRMLKKPLKLKLKPKA